MCIQIIFQQTFGECYESRQQGPAAAGRSKQAGPAGSATGRKAGAADAAARPEARPRCEQELNSREPRRIAGFLVSDRSSSSSPGHRNRTAVMAPQIALIEDGPGSYRFTFASARGEISGRVTVGIEGPPDKRSNADREQAAKNQILALS